jgi:hypothetical protein
MPASPPNPTPRATDEPRPATPELAPEDFYMDGPYLVFTAAYHLKRGYCCNSGCRHCPYGDSD